MTRNGCQALFNTGQESRILWGMESGGMGAYVRARRERMGNTLTELALRAELSKSELSALESGKIKFPSAAKRRRLAAALGVAHLDLLVAAGELTADEVTQGTTPVAARPEVEALCAQLRRVEAELGERDLLVLRRALSGYERPVVPAASRTAVTAST
jgi:transcriptional regulator with XRE-family HTH domain